MIRVDFPVISQIDPTILNSRTFRLGAAHHWGGGDTSPRAPASGTGGGEKGTGKQIARKSVEEIGVISDFRA